MNNVSEILKQHAIWLETNDLGKQADLSGADLNGAVLIRADLSGADLNGANLSGADLNGANLSGVNLSRADLSGADLSGADLSRADLNGANLSGANLRRADLSGADLSGADLSRANLSKADLSEADLSGANLRAIKGKTIYTLSSTQYTAFYIKEDNLITIGCKNGSVEFWLKNGRGIALRHNFTEEEIELYSDWVEWCATK